MPEIQEPKETNVVVRPKFFIDAYWAGEPSASGRDDDCLWYHADKKNRVHKGDRVLLYENKGHPDRKQLRGSEKVFQCGTVVSDLIKVENLPKVGGKVWEYKMILKTEIKVDRDKGIEWEKIRKILGRKRQGRLRNPPISISESQFVQIQNELRNVAGILIRDLESASLTPTATDISKPPPRVSTEIYRVLRDTQLSRQIKVSHGFRCQVCHCPPLKLSPTKFYAEVHHVKPLGSPHNGPDIPENILCVCPNCHVLLDYGAILLDMDQLQTSSTHSIGREYIEYYNQKILGKVIPV